MLFEFRPINEYLLHIMKILIVEDHVLTAQSLKDSLGGKNVIDVTYDGEQGLFLAESSDYDLIILDQVLPKKCGTDICRELRQDGIKTPILMLTQKQAISDKVSGLDSGADDYLVKPFNLQELQARVRALTRRPQASITPQTLSSGPLSLDTVTQTVTFDSTIVALRKKEYCILEYLLRHKDKTVTQNMLLEKIWEENCEHVSNTVAVHIKYLRDKIDKRFGVTLIVTIHGFGYRLVDIGPK